MSDVGQGEWIRVCAAEDVPVGQMYAVELDTLPPVVIFNVEGQLHATSNLCTHNVALLSDGSFAGRIVECPLHGGAFDVVTGEAAAFPCEVAIQRFQVRKDGDDVFVQAGAAGS